METIGWDRVYRQQGPVQSNVLPKVIVAADKFRGLGHSHILDLACGTGRHAIYLAREGFDVGASDISANGLAIAKQQAVLAGVNIEFTMHDMNSIPYRDESFDAVLCVWSIGLGRINEIRRRIVEISRVLKYGGTLISDFMSVCDETWGKGRQVEVNTFLGAMEGLPDLTEHYSTREELASLFAVFNATIIEEADHYYFDGSGQKHIIRALDIEATK